MRWTARWIAQAQRKADLRDERYRRRAEAVRAGKRPPGLMDRLEAREQRAAEILEVADAWYQGRMEYRMRLADEVYALLRPGRVCGPDGVEVSICVRYAGPYWAGRWEPRGRRLRGASLRLLAVRAGYRVHAQTMSGPLIKVVRWFPGETAATIAAVGLAKSVQRGGADALRQAARQIPAGEDGSEVIC